MVKTNSYAPLIVKVNDKLVEEKTYSLGDNEISVDESLINDTMMIQLFAVSSGWKIWAPTVYELNDINFVVKSYHQQPNEFKFSISEDEYNAFKSGRIDLQLDENIGSLIAKLNNNILFSGITDDYNSIEFDQSSLRPEENTLSIEADVNSLFVGEANLIIFYEKMHENRLEQEFNLTEGEYNTLEKGRISFDVVDVIESGGISVKITNDGEELFSEYLTAEERTYTLNFDKGDVKSGTNLLLIESIDDALFAIDDIEIIY